MYVTQIDNIIDQMLDKLYLEELYTNETVNYLIEKKVINFVEYFDQINSSIKNFMDTIDKTAIQSIVSSKENVIHIIDIIKRYVAYYYFLYIGFYYAGTIKEYRNNIIQFSKLQETSKYHIKNFFDTENNYRLVTFYRLIKDTIQIIMLTDLQKKNLDQIAMKDAFEFLNRLGENYVNNYFLTIDVKDNEKIEPNAHNIIKTIVFFELYQYQERQFIFSILNQISEADKESIYIDIVVSVDITQDYENFRRLFAGMDRRKSERMAKSLYELINSVPESVPEFNDNSKNSRLISIPRVTVIADDFLRYHRDSFRSELNEKTPIILTSNNNAQNVQLVIKNQQRKKKENTRAQLILNKIDAIQSLYSPNVRNNPTTETKIKQLFYEPLANRKVVLHNYIEEIEIIDKMRKTETYITSVDEYYLEMVFTTTRAFFNFKDFKQYGTSVVYDLNRAINVLRYSNIEYPGSDQMLDIHTGAYQSIINMVGLTIGPLNGEQIRCIPKNRLVDIRSISINYKDKTVKTDNGYTRFLRLMKYYCIDPIAVIRNPDVELTYNYGESKELNPEIYDKVIYWIYDPIVDTFKLSSYESIDQKLLLVRLSESKTDNSMGDFQEKIKKMNSQLYTKLMSYYKTKVEKLILASDDFSVNEIYDLIGLFCNKYGLMLTQNDIQSYLRRHLARIKIDKPVVGAITPEENTSEFISEKLDIVPKLKIDFTDPIHPKKYIKMEISRGTVKDQEIEVTDNKCVHELEWDDVQAKSNAQGDEFKKALLKFIQTFLIESSKHDFSCKICGQALEIVHFVQDCKFNNTVGRYVTPYTTAIISLKNMKEYINYSKTITYLKKLIKRLSFLSSTNMLSGTDDTIKQRRNGVVKQIIDLFIKHNSINMKSKISDEERGAFYAKHFGIDKKFSSLFFFELNDDIFDFSTMNITQHSDINKLKINNIILYLFLIFLTEINEPQLMMSANDKYANIYVYLKYGDKLFEGLKIKRNVSDATAVPILEYPVLCYTIYLVAYLLDRYKLWQYSTGTPVSKIFNPSILKNIINSLVELFDSISISYNNVSNDFTYSLFIGKFYSQMNTIFSDLGIINILKKRHMQYSPDAGKAEIVERKKVETMPIGTINVKTCKYKIPVFRASFGVPYDILDKIVYQNDTVLNDRTNCPSGDYHHWIMKSGSFSCTKCGTVFSEDIGQKERSVENYYFTEKNFVKRLEKRICNDGADTQLTKLICNQKNPDIDKIEDVLEKINNEKNIVIINEQVKDEGVITKAVDQKNKIIDDLKMRAVKVNEGNEYGIITPVINKFITLIGSIIGKKMDLGIDKYPVYVDDNVYIIDHYYDGSLPAEPIILTQKENKMMFKENHPFFKTDVYYYTDNRSTAVDVFYHAITLKMLGYRQKNNDFVTSHLPYYLKISRSISDKLFLSAFPTKYIISKNMTYEKLDDLVRDHIKLTKQNIDFITRTISKIINFSNVNPEEEPMKFKMPTTMLIENMVTKYAQTLERKMKVEPAFDDWMKIRNAFTYEKIDWKTTAIDLNNIISSDTLGYYDIISGLMMFYLMEQFEIIINENTDKILRNQIALMFVELINYVYSVNNIDAANNIHDVKRYDYIINASNVMVDLLRKGQGLLLSEQMEKQLEDMAMGIEAPSEEELIDEVDSDELEDIREEAEALDVEAEEDEDYGYSEFE